jgi:hypothetical protein
MLNLNVAYHRTQIKAKYQTKVAVLIDQVREVLRYRHYAYRTEQALCASSAVPRLQCERFESLVPRPKVRARSIKSLPEMPDPIFIDQAIARVTELGRINHTMSNP